MILKRALRDLVRRPWAALPIVVTIALATGFVSAAATVVYTVLLRPLPYADAGQLVVLDHAVPRGEIPEWRARLRQVEGVAGASSADHAVRGLARARILRVAFVSTGFFATVRPQVLAGRLPAPGEAAAVVISERVLRQDGAAIPSVLGTTLTAAGRSFTVVGVVPADVGAPDATTDLWVPADAAEAIALVRADDRRFGLIGRLRVGATTAQAGDEATRVRQALSTEDAAGRSRLQVVVTRLDERARGTSGRALWAFLCGGAVMLLVAAANVASLLLSRTLARERELAVSFSLGAGRARVALSLFAEATLLSALGSALGLCLAVAGIAMLRSLAAGTVPRLEEAAVDLTMIAFTAAISLVVGALCTIGPAWFALRRGMATLVRPAAGARGRGHRLQSVLAGTQLALSIVLVVTAVLLTRTIDHILDVPTGVRADGVLTARVMLGERTLLSPSDSRAFADQLLAEVRRLPGVQRAGFASSLPPATSIIEMAIRTVEEGRDETMMMALVAATPDWAGTVSLPLVDGRFLRPEDAEAEHPGVVVSRSVARHLFGNRPAVGRSMPSIIPGTGDRQGRVVGVVEDVRYSGLLAKPGGAVYVPWDALRFGVVRLVVRTTGDPASLAGSVAAAARRLDPARPVEDVGPLNDVVAASVASHRMYALVAKALAVSALAVALVGLLATLARAVTLRRHEFAVRLAVGATSRELAALVLRHASAVIAAGIVAGLPLAWAAARGVAAYLHGVSAEGMDTYVVVALGTGAAALLACLWPAWRAWSTSPLVLLRTDN